MTTRTAPLWLLALITFSGTLAMHIFVPAMPYAAIDLGASVSEIQLTVSLYIVGLAVGQLVYGPLSDIWGRRPVLMAGLALYTVSGLVAALAPDTQALVAARLFQALGGCAGLVLGRAIVRDTGTLEQSAKRLALLTVMVSVGPGLAPLIGGALASAFGWRSIFYLLCVLGMANLLGSWRLLPESAPAPALAGRSNLRRDYWQLVRAPAFLGYAVGGGCCTTAAYAFLAAAPFIFVNQLHRPAYEVGIYLALLVSGAVLGSVLTSRLIGRISIDRLLLAASAISLLAMLVLLGATLRGQPGLAWIVGPMFVFMAGSGMAGPAAVTQAVSVNTRLIGSASGLYGFIQMVVGALCTGLVGLGRDPALAAALILTGSSILGHVSFRIAIRARH